MYESMTPEMIDWQTEANRQLERARRIERQLEQLQEEQAAILPEDVGLKEWAAAQQKRIAEMEAEIAENDEMFELQRERTIEASREWQQATGQHNVWPDLGTLIDWLRGDRARLRGALERLRNGDDQPEYHSGIVDAGMDAWDANDNHAAAEHGWDICQELYGYWIEAEVEAALSPTGQRDHPDTVGGIYVASRSSVPARAAMWRELRGQGAPIISSWIDESGEGQTASFSELWQRIVSEIRSCCGLIVYVEPDDLPLKGAYVEVGMALALGKPVIVVAPGVAFNHDGKRPRPLGSWVAHPRVQFRDDIHSAIAALKEAPHG